MTGLRIKCPKCGKVTDITGPTSCICGENLEAFPGTLKIYRMGSPIGVAVPYGIYFNDMPWGHLANTETGTYTLPYGTYRIHITLGATRRCKDVAVTLSPENPVACFKARVKPGFWSNTIIIDSCNASDIPQ